MQSTSRQKRQRPSTNAGRPPSRRRRKLEAGAPRTVESLTKNELVALVLELQARAGAPLEPEEGKAPEAPLPEPATDIPQAIVARASPASLMIDTSVRSGQTIEFPDGDVTVIGSVGSGAEIIAGGSIHIYGTLRGRAIAGTSGDPKARIFCRNLQAEFLSIDGRYRVAENFDPTLEGRCIQARLEGVGMALTPMD